MPRGNNMPASLTLLKALILGDPKAGKTDWSLRAAEAGFNVLYMDGDVGAQTIAGLSPAAQNRVFYMDIADKLDSGVDPRMIQTVADFFTSSRFLWNDTKQRAYSRTKDEHDAESGAAVDEIWEFRPAKLDHNWVLVVDSWTTLSYSAMLAKANDQGESLADVEKIERSLYQGVGNRLTNILATIQKAPCHVVVIGHPMQYEKRKSQEGKTVKEAMKENDLIVEWTKMIPKSSSNPHGLTMGKFFSDIGWIDVDKWGKRKLCFKITNQRVSGGHLEGEGDPRGDYDFARVIQAIGGKAPGADSATPLGEGLIIHPPGTYIPASVSKALPLGSKATPASTTLEPAKVSQVKGLGGLAGLKKS